MSLTKFDWESGELKKGDSRSTKFWGVVLVGLVGFGVWFTLGGHVVVFKAIMGVLGL